MKMEPLQNNRNHQLVPSHFPLIYLILLMMAPLLAWIVIRTFFPSVHSVQ
uniref:Uncharacterized protein n=1 Tax=Arundo donax TaxID=35708 RepID=A0A0A9FAK1_ARUDO